MGIQANPIIGINKGIETNLVIVMDKGVGENSILTLDKGIQAGPANANFNPMDKKTTPVSSDTSYGEPLNRTFD
jgi:hypothetical protein